MVLFARAVVRSLLLLVGAGLTTSCNGFGDMAAPRTVGAPVTSVVLSTEQFTLSEGASVALLVTALDANNRPLANRTVLWSSSDSMLARVSAAGVVTALRVGRVQIAVSVDGRSAVAQLTIAARAVASVQLTPTTASVLKGGFVQLTARTLDDAGAPLIGRAVFWSTSDTRVAVVDANGRVTGIAPGAVTATATSESRSAAVGVTVVPVPVASVQLTPTRDTVVLGQATQLTATPRDSTGAPLDDPVTFSTSAGGIATVSSLGLVLGVATGAATITASSGTRSATANITVLPRPVGAVIVSPAQSTLTVGQSLRLATQVTDANGNPLTGRPISFSSSRVNVAQVTADGTVTAMDIGLATITASSEGKSGTASVTIALSPIATLRIDPSSGALLVGGSMRLAAVALDASGNVLTQRAVTWTSGAPSVVLVSADGVVSAVGAGTALVLAAAEGRLASATISVANPAPSTVHISPSASTLMAGQLIDLVATLRDGAGQVVTGRTVQWVSSGSTVAVVSSTGRVRGVSPGVARIDAIVDGVTGSSAVTVVPVPTATVSVTLALGSITVGQTSQASAAARDSVGGVLTDRIIAWTSSNTAVATVSANGVVNAIALGTTSIVATCEGKSGQAALAVVVGSPTMIAANSVLSQSTTVLTAVAAPPSVTVTDAAGIPVSGVAVTFTRTVGSGVIVPATPASISTNALGIATLTSWTLGAVPGTNTVTAAVLGLNGSPVTFRATGTAAAATQLVISTQPAGAVSGVAFTTQPVVAIHDATNTLTGSAAAVTVAIASGAGALTGTTTVNAVNGVATFTNLRIAGAGAHTLTFTSAALIAATSTSTSVLQVAASLSVQTQPAGATSGVAFSTQPVVHILDHAGLVVTTGSGATQVVTAAIASGSGTLTGPATATAANGVATFANLRISGSGSHTLHLATSSPALSATSASFGVAASPATQLAVVTQPSGAVSGVVLTTQPVVAIRDASGVVSNSSAAVTVALVSGTGALIGTTTVNAVNGVATFTNVKIAGAGAHTMTFASAGLASANSSSFTVTQVAAALVVQTQPAGARKDANFTTQPVVHILDNAGLVVTTGSGASRPVTVSVATGSGRLAGTVTVTASNGVARFTNLRIDRTGPHTLRFATTAPTLSVISASFTVN